MGYGVVDPTIALMCPMGTAAGLFAIAQALGASQTWGDGSARSLRMLHLAKLFLLFRFQDHGTLYSHSRWQVNLPNIVSQAHVLQQAEKAAGQGATTTWVESGAKPRIALVTYCKYPPTTRLPELSRRNKHVYAALRGYLLDHVEEPLCAVCHPWMNKLLAIQRRLPTVDWLMWVDCDAFYMNMTRGIEGVISSALAANPRTEIIISEDGHM